MSMCLPGLYSGSATIRFHTTPFDQRISAEILPNPVFPYLYFINLYKLFINNKEIPLNPSIRNFRNDIDGGRVVDTGTILTTFPRDLYNVFRDTFRQEVQDFPLVDDPTGGSDTCYKVDILSGFGAWDELFTIVGSYNVEVHLSFRNPGYASSTKDMRVLTKSHESRVVVSGPSPTTPYDVDLRDDMFDEDDMLDMF
ncbi:hypothetical protein CQW23_16170 [Capsicum baccatum]|uniref:Xylanase inhibitor C-terminal domain-containing protein n=1 Tax=Capsicum baccatum TaxID=33114 RepID=A0A2G2WA95_CAPBA|nr:hypothetical protein CQW23_16170 [Capsicum baccatum]